MQRNIQRFFDSIKCNNFCIEHLDMAGLVTILKKEAYTLTCHVFFILTSLFVTLCFVTFRAKEVVTFCAKNLLHFALLFLHFVQKAVLKCLMSLRFALILSIIIFCGVTDTERPNVDHI